MSNIPEARNILRGLLRTGELQPSAKDTIWAAIKLMTRDPVVRGTPKKASPPTPQQRDHILRLARVTDMTQAEIAQRVGLGPQASGRVSEILHRAKKERQCI
jgi:hypothetical protein